MKVLPFNSDSLKEAVEVLKEGGIVAHPADTCFGLAGDFKNPEALKKIQLIKKRDPKDPMSIMISVTEQLNIEKYARLDAFSAEVVEKLFPSPVTLLLPKGPDIPDWYFPDTPNIGLRVPMHDLTQDLLAAFKGALITTSANLSGQPICFDFQEAMKQFENESHQPDLVFEGKSEKHDMASTILLIENDQIQMNRRGPITASQLEAILDFPVKE